MGKSDDDEKKKMNDERALGREMVDLWWWWLWNVLKIEISDRGHYFTQVCVCAIVLLV